MNRVGVLVIASALVVLSNARVSHAQTQAFVASRSLQIARTYDDSGSDRTTLVGVPGLGLIRDYDSVSPSPDAPNVSSSETMLAPVRVHARRTRDRDVPPVFIVTAESIHSDRSVSPLAIASNFDGFENVTNIFASPPDDLPSVTMLPAMVFPSTRP